MLSNLFFYTSYKKLTVFKKLIIINSILFLLFNLVELIFPKFSILNWFSFSTTFNNFLSKPWSIISYMFLHLDFQHLLWNSVLLYFSGRLFFILFNTNLFLKVYLLGGIVGGVFYLLFIGFFSHSLNAHLIGSSAAIISVLVFICVYMPQYRISFFFLNIKLWHIGFFLIVSDLISLGISNTGGKIAHLGGAFYGFYYAYILKNGFNFPKITFKTFSKKRKKHKSFSNQPVDKSFQNKIDTILDKISSEGYDSLTEEEKQMLFNTKGKL